jgi:hypothetical protein
MSEAIRALIVILVLSGALLYVVRPAVIQVIPEKTFDRWRKLWFFATLAWFLSFSFWLYAVVMACMLYVVRRKESHVMGLYFLLLFAAPAVQVPIPGLGIIDHLFMLDHYRILALFLLLPVALRLMRDPSTHRFGRSPVDWMLASYLVLTGVLGMLETSPTNAARIVFLQLIDGYLPYYVASRSIKSVEDFRGALAGLLIGALLVSVFAIFEVARSWKLYQASISEMGLFVHPHYKTRGAFLRPGASLLDSIVLGLVVIVALGAWLYLKDLVVGKSRHLLLWMVLGIGVLASLSRAPWLASVLMVFVFVAQGEKAVGRVMLVFMGLFLLMAVLSLFPAGRTIIDLIPIIGEAEQGSIEYRANWFSVAMPLIERNFWFGDPRVLQAPELEVMRQGEGIIDLVNLFLSVMLHYGVFGLFFFAGMFLRALWLVRRSEKGIRLVSKDLSRLGRALISIVIAMIFVLITLSSISAVPILIVTVLGLCSAYGFLIQAEWQVKRREMNVNERRTGSPKLYPGH